MALDILVVDDEPDIRELIAGVLGDEGYDARTADTAERALEEVRARTPRLVVLDVWLQGSGMDGLSLLKYLKSIDPLLPVIVISGHGNIETAVAAIRRGAYDFIEKPFKTDRLLHMVERAIESAALKYENAALKNRAGGNEQWIGDSHAASALRSSIDKVAPTNSRVLITGPAGAGKELAARLIHRNSQRENGPFVVVNAATIAPDQMESALFGEEDSEGRTTRIGLFEKAHNGTLLLDEVADMPLGTQNKILRVLTEQRFQRVGKLRQAMAFARLQHAARPGGAFIDRPAGSGMQHDRRYRLQDEGLQRCNLDPVAGQPAGRFYDPRQRQASQGLMHGEQPCRNSRHGNRAATDMELLAYGTKIRLDGVEIDLIAPRHASRGLGEEIEQADRSLRRPRHQETAPAQ